MKNKTQTKLIVIINGRRPWWKCNSKFPSFNLFSWSSNWNKKWVVHLFCQSIKHNQWFSFTSSNIFEEWSRVLCESVGIDGVGIVEGKSDVTFGIFSSRKKLNNVSSNTYPNWNLSHQNQSISKSWNSRSHVFHREFIRRNIQHDSWEENKEEICFGCKTWKIQKQCSCHCWNNVKRNNVFIAQRNSNCNLFEMKQQDEFNNKYHCRTQEKDKILDVRAFISQICKQLCNHTKSTNCSKNKVKSQIKVKSTNKSFRSIHHQTCNLHWQSQEM